KEEWKERVQELGGEIYMYVPNNAFIVKMNWDSERAVKDLPFVRWVGLYQPAYKLMQEVKEFRGYIPAKVYLFPGGDVDTVAKRVSLIGEVEDIDTTMDPIIKCHIYAEYAWTLARIDDVYWVEYSYPMKFFNNVANYIIQSGVQNFRPLYNHGIHGEGQIIGNADSGIHVSHIAFADPSRSVQFTSPSNPQSPDLQHRKIVNYWTYADSSDSANIYYHGTHTAAVNAGEDNSQGTGTYNGQAYKAKISFQDIGGSWSLQVPSNLNTLFGWAYSDGARIHSDSWGSNTWGAYDGTAMQADQFMWNHKDMLIVFSNANSGPYAGSVGSPATAKNVLSLGAAVKNLNGDMQSYSSRGPTDDGRLKPTIYAPTDEVAARGGTTNQYWSQGGTSNSCPTAAGGAVLVRQYFAEGWYPTGVKTPQQGFNASAALIKAIIVNGAEEKFGSNAHSHNYNGMPYPNNDQGWGYMNLDNALYFRGDSRKLFIDDNTTGLNTGESVQYSVDIVSNNEPLEITLVWTDYPGTTGAATELVNNLDLKVVDPNGQTYYGNVFSTGSVHESTTGGNQDAKNVEENVLFKTPSPGGYQVTVTATNVPHGPQPFALVITGNITIKPDLVIKQKDVRGPEHVPMEGETVYINGTFHGYGEITQPVLFKVYLDGEEFQESSESFTLGPDRDFSIEWTGVQGTHTFRLVLDPDDVLEEADETNNQVEVTFWVNDIPRANLTADKLQVYTYEPVTFSGEDSQDSGGVTWYYFDFGDGVKSNWRTKPTVTHKYKDNGNYTVKLRVKDNMSVVSDWVSLDVEVLNRIPVANASASAYSIYTLIDVAFDASASSDMDGTISYLWDFGDNTTATGVTAVHNFTDNGNYTVTLTVTDDDGAVNSTSFTLEVLNRQPTVDFEVSDHYGNATTPFQFTSDAYDQDGYIVEYLWDFGDGNTS
ncbi:MAG: hypothetical protein DRO01_07030, partial [Thermoproteota archaeon]